MSLPNVYLRPALSTDVAATQIANSRIVQARAALLDGVEKILVNFVATGGRKGELKDILLRQLASFPEVC